MYLGKIVFLYLLLTPVAIASHSRHTLPEDYQLKCTLKKANNVFHYDASEVVDSDTLKEWDPERLPKNYLIVHGIKPTLQGLTDLIVHYYSCNEKFFNKIYEERSILRYAPFLQYYKTILSASLINKQKKATYAPYGLVLSVPPENIVATFPFDGYSLVTWQFFEASGDKIKSDMNDFVSGTGSNEWILNKKRLKEMGFDRPFLPPKSLLAHTHPHRINEVLFVPRSSSGKEIKVVGIFVESQEFMERFDKVYGDLTTLRQMSKDLNIPIISLENFKALSPECEGDVCV